MKPPTLVFHELTPSLKEGGKMSKSDQSSAIFHGDDEKTIREKIAKAWCRPGVVEGNGILGIFRDCIFPWITIEVDGVMYADYSVLEAQYEAGKVHPKALKDACANALVHLMKV